MSEPFERREADQIDGLPAPESGQFPLQGHHGVLSKLESALAAGRLPGAIMLHGPRGIGKATAAFALTRSILTATGDETPERVEAQVAALSHPNLTVLRRARDPGNLDRFYTAIRVDEVRSARDTLHRTRGRSGYRVAIIDSVDDCNVNSANALLKTLEEPPSETVFIVISHRPGGLLPTIRSRCQSYGLRPLPDEDVRAVLTAHRPELAGETLDRAVNLAVGRPRRAFETLMLEDSDVLDGLITWLGAPAAHPAGAHLTIASALAGSKGAEAGFAREVILDWIASHAREAARGGAGGRLCLASANALWDKANALFADADIYNLDHRQTLTAVFDAIRDHARQFMPASPIAQ